EKEEAPGGRVRTDSVQGFRLDRGFQVWLEAYPQCRKRLSPSSLRAGAFGSGAMIFDGNRLRLFADPFRHPSAALSSLLHPVGSLGDKLRLQMLRRRLSRRSLPELLSGEEFSTLDHWRRLGFSPEMIRGFLAPFFRGIFLAEPEEISRRMFDFVFSMFGQGPALLPAGGIQAIPDALAEGLTPEELRLSTPVQRVSAGEVLTVAGEKIPAAAVVVSSATPETLEAAPERKCLTPRAVSCLYFDAPAAPVQGPWLVLNGSGSGRVTQVAVHSAVAAELAPEGRHLISVSLNGSEADFSEITGELRRWFGPAVEDWNFLRTYEIPHALPAFGPGELPGPGFVEQEGVLYCGDNFSHPSLQGAMESGERAAKELLNRLR
ncbi:MAG: FAD-dependent oxidoreductase, partial [Kiritimatiellia bacterium]